MSPIFKKIISKRDSNLFLEGTLNYQKKLIKRIYKLSLNVYYLFNWAKTGRNKNMISNVGFNNSQISFSARPKLPQTTLKEMEKAITNLKSNCLLILGEKTPNATSDYYCTFKKIENVSADKSFPGAININRFKIGKSDILNITTSNPKTSVITPEGKKIKHPGNTCLQDGSTIILPTGQKIHVVKK